MDRSAVIRDWPGRGTRPLARACVAVATLVAGLAPLPTFASVGTGVGASALVLADSAHAGGSYSLGSFYLVNTGTEASRYAVHVERFGRGTTRDVPASWIALARTDIGLDPGKSASVPVTLTVPADAAAGDYMTDLVAGTVTPSSGGGGTSLGAAAATEVRFSVTAGGGLIPWPWPTWVYLPLVGGLVLGAAWIGIRRAGVRLQIEWRH